jgi:hypothetical protein
VPAGCLSTTRTRRAVALEVRYRPNPLTVDHTLRLAALAQVCPERAQLAQGQALVSLCSLRGRRPCLTPGRAPVNSQLSIPNSQRRQRTVLGFGSWRLGVDPFFSVLLECSCGFRPLVADPVTKTTGNGEISSGPSVSSFAQISASRASTFSITVVARCVPGAPSPCTARAVPSRGCR